MKCQKTNNSVFYTNAEQDTENHITFQKCGAISWGT